MGKTLIIYAHPHTQGHCLLIKDEVQRQLREHKVEYNFFDLYALKYDPVLHENEHYTAGADHREISDQNKMFQKKISEAEKLIFIYPIWWNSMPAILKGWCDRVFTSHFAFKYGRFGISFAPIPLLRGKEALLLITGGSPRILSWIFLRDRAAKIMSKDILGFCGIRTSVCQFGNCRTLTDEKAEKIKKTTAKKLASFYGW